MRRPKVKDSLLAGTILSRCILLLLIILAGACNQPDEGKSPQGTNYGKIIYDTAIINRDSTDSWAAESLSGLDRKALIDKILKAVYDGKITPYDYFSGEKMSVRQIKKLETTEFSREDISKIKFEERWIWDEEKAEMQKQLISLTLAYDVYDNSGNSRGQKPIFKLIFRK